MSHSMLFLSFVFVLPLVAHSAQVMDYQSALKYAFENSPDLQITKKQRLIKKLSLENSEHNLYWPSLSLSSRLGSGDDNSQDYNSSSLGISANIFNGGRDWTQLEVSQIELQATELRAAESREAFALELFLGFSQYSRLKALLEIAEQRSQVVTGQFERVRRSFRAGVETRADFLRFQAQEKRAKISLEQSRAELQLAKNKIIRLLGGELEASRVEIAELPETVELRSLKLPDITKHRLLDIARAQVEIDKLQLKQQKWDLWPEADLTASAFKNYASSYWSGENSQGWLIGLDLSFDLFGFAKQKREVQIAQSQVHISDLSFEAKKLELQESLQALKIETDLTQEELKLSKELLALDQQSFDRVSSQYRTGRSSYLEYIEALNNLLDSKRAVIGNSYTYQEKLAEWRYYEGRTYDQSIQK